MVNNLRQCKYRIYSEIMGSRTKLNIKRKEELTAINILHVWAVGQLVPVQPITAKTHR